MISSDLTKPVKQQQRSYQIQSYQDRRQCKYWQQSGCLLDAMEKVCEEQGDLDELISPTGSENVNLCCCPQPYKACQRSEADQLCLQLIEKYFTSIFSKSKTTIKNSEEAENRKEVFMQKLQSVRSELLAKEGKYNELLASPKPLAKCSMVPSSKPFDRHDLICEMLTWQWEELGDGDKDEFERIGCPFVEKDKMDDDKATERKGSTEFLSEEGDSENDMQPSKMEL